MITQEHIKHIKKAENERDKEKMKKEFIHRHLQFCADADTRVLSFISDIELNGGTSDDTIETIYSLFATGYCYYFARMLEDAFPGGTVCWAAPFGHIIYLYKDIPYDISGVYGGESEEFIPVSFLGDALDDFRHIPGQEYNATEKDLENIRKRWKQETKKELMSDECRKY